MAIESATAQLYTLGSSAVSAIFSLYGLFSTPTLIRSALDQGVRNSDSGAERAPVVEALARGLVAHLAATTAMSALITGALAQVGTTIVSSGELTTSGSVALFCLLMSVALFFLIFHYVTAHRDVILLGSDIIGPFLGSSSVRASTALEFAALLFSLFVALTSGLAVVAGSR